MSDMALVEFGVWMLVVKMKIDWMHIMREIYLWMPSIL